MSLEGTVYKRADSLYVSGRTRDWLKVTSYAEAIYDIIGVQREPGQPALVLADGGELQGAAPLSLYRAASASGSGLV